MELRVNTDKESITYNYVDVEQVQDVTVYSLKSITNVSMESCAKACTALLEADGFPASWSSPYEATPT